MKEQRKAHGGIRGLIERNCREAGPVVVRAGFVSQIQSGGDGAGRSPSNPSDAPRGAKERRREGRPKGNAAHVRPGTG